jgi:GMP synthase (glutamine-hydrolysing)
VLGVCYGAQLTAKQFGGRVEKSSKREYGRAVLQRAKEDLLLSNVSQQSQVWMSHADTILELPQGFELLATTENIPVAAFKKNGAHNFPLWTPVSSGSVSFDRREKNTSQFPGEHMSL